jgi:archaeosine-15-forming tRNA-guanine transglycosylase
MKGTKNVGFRAAIPLVIVYAFGVTVADKFATATVAFFAENTGPVMEFVAEKSETLVAMAKTAVNGNDD